MVLAILALISASHLALESFLGILLRVPFSLTCTFVTSLCSAAADFLTLMFFEPTLAHVVINLLASISNQNEPNKHSVYKE